MLLGRGRNRDESSCGYATLTKTLIANFDELACWLQIGTPRYDDPATVERLERVNERRPVMLFENISADLEHVIRAEPQEVAIERCVMQRTQGDPVSDKWLSGWFRVGDYVGGIMEFFVAQAAERALTLIRLQHALTEGSLVESNTDRGGDVHTTSAIGVLP